MMGAISTISTVSHMHKTYALAHSLNRFGYTLNVLLVDQYSSINTEYGLNIKIYNLSDIKSKIGQQIIRKYKNNLDKLRWGLKPVFLNLLLKKHNNVLYCDNDLYFFKSPKLYFDLLDSKSLLLTPHFYKSEYNHEQNWLEANFKVGLYNAGFVGASKMGVEALNWWAGCCLYNIKKSFRRGLFDDQKYLDLLPILFNNVEVLKNKGSNVAGWNYNVLRPEAKEIIFIHFADLSLREFQKPNNKYHSFFEEYVATLRRYKENYAYRPDPLSRYAVFIFLDFLRWKMIRLLEKGAAFKPLKDSGVNA